mmetsp:Transcript_2042/g.7294  ORF Transcript_2042/g.7294 Transcript_2042/m.7294 type:complete len:96 (+) Transcript_2042:66-353(+)
MEGEKNFVHEDENWRQRVRYENQTSREFNENWGFLTQNREDMVCPLLPPPLSRGKVTPASIHHAAPDALGCRRDGDDSGGLCAEELGSARCSDSI